MARSGVRASVVPLSLEELVAIADQVVEVEVTDSTSHPYKNMIVTTSKFQVVDRLKGDLKGEQSITYLGGRVGKLVMEPTNVPQLQRNDRAILFLSKPYERLPKELKSRYNASSPLLNSYSIVGGVQGKLDVFAGEKGGRAKIVRGATATALGKGDKSREVDAETLKSSIRTLVSAQATKAAKKDFKTIKGVYGTFAIPDRSTDPAVRAFDPLPGMAYMSTEEINAAVEEAYAGAGPAPAAPAPGDGGTGGNAPHHNTRD
ncbi:hypothetical protein IT570_09695 [Candidatus Sumerlaeota bacterium]|nr:hypothetical protein [Candidatus Sumerlaeota bacterium]